MADCENLDVRDVLPDLIHGTLDAATRARVESHLSGCAPCRAELALLRHLYARRGAPAVDVAGIVAAVQASARVGAGSHSLASPEVASLASHRARRGQRGRPRPVTWARVVAIAAALLLVASVAVLGERRQARDGAPIDRMADGTPGAAPIAAPDSQATGPGPDARRGDVPVPATRQLAQEGGRGPDTSRTAQGIRDALGALGGVTAGLTDAELEALLAGLDDLSGIPEVEAEEGEAGLTTETGGRG